jgi:DnaJ-class molecular chaperone
MSIIECPKCNGSGHNGDCGWCNGRGQVMDINTGKWITCPRCKGKGKEGTCG